MESQEKQKKSMTTFTVDIDGEEYVMQGGGGITPGVPIPRDTVDTEAIMDGAVEMQDLNDTVKNTMMTGDDRVTQDDLAKFDV